MQTVRCGMALIAVAIMLGILVGATAGCGEDESDEDIAVQVGETTNLDVGVNESSATTPAGGPEDLRKLPALRRGETTGQLPAIRGSAGLSLAEWLHAVNTDIATFWRTSFNAGGLSYTAPKEVIYNQPISDACGRLDPKDSAAYCSLDQTVLLALPYEGGLFRDFGDTAVAVSVAHENGHHVQNLLTIKRRFFDAPKGASNPVVLRSRAFELQADCLAGIWAFSVGARGLFEQGDVEEGLFSRNALGDPPGTSPKDPQAHGSGPQRARAFQRGLESGNPDVCL
jgi:predicted metalloprotease